MTAPITFFEHEVHLFDWSDRDRVTLERLSHVTGVESLTATLCHGQRALQTAQYVGVVRLGKHTFQILPKIYRSVADEAQRAREATRNLLYLLEYAGELPVREHALAPLLQRGADWFEILTRLFANHLAEEWQRGAHRGYQSVQDDLPVMKGKWRITEQIRRPERKHIFAVAYDEFTADNPLNRVFRFVVERLWHLTQDADNRQYLGELRQWMDEVMLLPSVNAADATPALLTRLNQRYEPLLNLARLFLEGAALQLAAGDLTTFAFVFDMNALFEAFLVNFIRRHRVEILPPDLQECDLLPQARGASLYLAKREERRVFYLNPDLALRNEGKSFPLLVDAKYKRLDPADVKLGVSQDDFYQMHAYAYRYDCPRVALIYPQTAEMPEPLYCEFRLENSDKMIVAATVNMQDELKLAHERQRLIDELERILGGPA